MRRLSFIIISLLAASSSVMAQKLTLDECRKMALEHNKALESARVQEEKLTSDVKSYRANYMPKLDIMALDAYSWGSADLTLPMNDLAKGMLTQMAPALLQSGMMNQQQLMGLSQLQLQDPSLEFKPKNVFVGAATLTQPLYTGGKITAAYEMSKIGKEMAASNVRLTESQVIVNTTEAYLLAVKAKQLTEVARSYKALLDELQKNVDAAVKHGLKTRNDALKVQVKRNEVELNIQKADNAYRLACMNLCQVTGLDLNSNISVDENSVKETGIGSDAKALSQASIEARPEFSILSNKTKLAQKKVKLVQSDYLPTVAAIGSYSYLDGMELAGKKLFKGNGAFSVGVTVKIPVIGYLTEGVHKTRSARAEQRIAQLEQEELNEKMTLELTQCANNYSESVLEMDITRKSTIQAEENLKMSKQQYEVGLEPLSDYLEAQALWQSAKANEIEARYQNQLAYMKYLKAKGEL